MPRNVYGYHLHRGSGSPSAVHGDHAGRDTSRSRAPPLKEGLKKRNGCGSAVEVCLILQASKAYFAAQQIYVMKSSGFWAEYWVRVESVRGQVAQARESCDFRRFIWLWE